MEELETHLSFANGKGSQNAWALGPGANGQCAVKEKR